MVIKKIVSFAFALVLAYGIYSFTVNPSGAASSSSSDHVRFLKAAMIFESSTENFMNKTYDIVSDKFFNLIDSKAVPIITNSVLLNILMELKKDAREIEPEIKSIIEKNKNASLSTIHRIDKAMLWKIAAYLIQFDTSDWDIYFDQDDLFLLIPHAYIQEKKQEWNQHGYAQKTASLQSSLKATEYEMMLGFKVANSQMVKISSMDKLNEILSKKVDEAIDYFASKMPSSDDDDNEPAYTENPYYQREINIEAVKNIFVQDQRKPIALGEWNFIITGHGTATTQEYVQKEPLELMKHDEQAAIACIPLKGIDNLLTFFSSHINVSSVAIKSCFSGGYHHKKMAHFIAKATASLNTTSHNYALITLGYDAVAFVAIKLEEMIHNMLGISPASPFKTYFSELERFFTPILNTVYHAPQDKQTALFDTRVEQEKSKLFLIVNNLFHSETSSGVLNIPNLSLVTTGIAMREKVGQKIIDDTLVQKMINDKSTQLDIGRNSILLETQVVPFEIIIDQANPITSLLSRNALHFFEAITHTWGNALDSILEGLFLSPYQDKSVYKKAFHIKKITIKKGQNISLTGKDSQGRYPQGIVAENVWVLRDPVDSDTVEGIAIMEYNSKHYKTDFTTWSQITKKEYDDIVSTMKLAVIQKK